MRLPGLPKSDSTTSAPGSSFSSGSVTQKVGCDGGRSVLDEVPPYDSGRCRLGCVARRLRRIERCRSAGRCDRKRRARHRYRFAEPHLSHQLQRQRGADVPFERQNGEADFTKGISGPHFIAIGLTKLYVANSNGAEVTAYDPKSGKQTKPTISQNLQYAMGLAVGAKGVVYVGDYTNGTVTTYNGKNGKQLALTISGLANPLGIAVDKQNKVYVAQTGAVSVFNADGSAAFTITNGIDAPQAVAVDLNGKIYVSNCPASAADPSPRTSPPASAHRPRSTASTVRRASRSIRAERFTLRSPGRDRPAA